MIEDGCDEVLLFSWGDGIGWGGPDTEGFYEALLLDGGQDRVGWS
jgi:hypothetical protein